MDIKAFVGDATPIISIYDNVVFADKINYDRLMKAKMDGQPMWRHATDDEIELYIYNNYDLGAGRLRVNMLVNNTNKTGFGKLSAQILKSVNSEKVKLAQINQAGDVTLVINSVWIMEQFNILKNLKTKNPNKPLYVFTMWETNKWHELHVAELNYADVVIVPNQWNADTLKECGYTGRIEILNLPMTSGFEYVDRDHSTFTFLTYNGGDSRKGFPLYLKAFRDEFKDETDVQYVVKTTPFTQFEKNIKEFRKDHDISKVKYITQNYSDEQLQDLLGDADCFVFPSSGEGWGYTPLEAVTSGLPVILPKKHAFIDHWNDAYIEIKAKLVKSEFQTVDEHIVADDIGEWYKCSKKDLQAKMREVYEAWKAGDKTLWDNAKQESSKVLTKYSLKETRKKLTNILTKSSNKTTV
jgi:glycosyltransferase involved in cell wall biosynthesis